MKILLVGYGYIGQYLFRRLKMNNYEVEVVSKSIENSPGFFCSKYQDLTETDLQSYSFILWFAGHSSVGACLNDPLGAVYNNTIDLFKLALKKPDKCRLIYASSASIYSGLSDIFASISDGRIESNNAYDSSKKSLDILMQNLDLNTTGLRMGTLSGWSTSLRPELIFNSMNLSAINNSCIQVANRENYRSILFLEDLWKIIELQLNYQESKVKFLNCGSINLKIGEMAEHIASFYKVPIIDYGNSGSYSFRMRLSKKSSLSAKEIVHRNCKIFKNEITNGMYNM